jgi:hypothetical protein
VIRPTKQPDSRSHYERGHCVIHEVHGVDAEGFGPASGITYTGTAYFDDHSVAFTGIVPSQLRPPDGVDTQAAPIGSAGFAFITGGVLYILVTEYPRMDEECPDPGA